LIIATENWLLGKLVQQGKKLRKNFKSSLHVEVSLTDKYSPLKLRQFREIPPKIAYSIYRRDP